jgi:hypothetical protein
VHYEGEEKKEEMLGTFYVMVMLNAHDLPIHFLDDKDKYSSD